MNFVSSMPASRTGFESIVYQAFGSNVPTEAVIAASALIAITLLFKSTLVSSDLR